MTQDNVISTELTPTVNTSMGGTSTIAHITGATIMRTIPSSIYSGLTTNASTSAGTKEKITTSSLNSLIARIPNAEDTSSDIFNSMLSSLRTDLGVDKVNYLQKVINDYVDFTISNALTSQSMAIHPIIKERDMLENKLEELKIEYAKAIEAKAINSKGE